MQQILYFTTPTCGPCKMFKPVVQQVSAELGIHIQTVDASVQTELVQKFGITSVPTIIVVKNGQPVYRSIGVTAKTQLINTLGQFK